MRRALGLMSGTSADGLSLAVIEVRGGRVEVAAHADFAYPKALQRRILSAASLDAAGLCRLNFELGRLYARNAESFLRARSMPARTLSAVGSHGQTVAHDPGSATLQIGEPSFLAEVLGVPVVSDFRPRDIAAGGQGAPLIPFFDEELFGDGPPRILQNIGGIANCALVGRGTRTLGFDTGPGNGIIDAAVRRMTRGRLAFDRGGAIARRGAVDEGLARRLARDAWFSRRPPKSLDRAAYSERYLAEKFSRRMNPADVVATATYFTALTIADAYRRFLPARQRSAEVVVSGGGAFNPVLLEHLRRLAAPRRVLTIDAFGIPAQAKEPAAMALMALYAVIGRSNHCPAATGARSARILGKITPSSGRSFGRRKRA